MVNIIDLLSTIWALLSFYLKLVGRNQISIIFQTNSKTVAFTNKNKVLIFVSCISRRCRYIPNTPSAQSMCVPRWNCIILKQPNYHTGMYCSFLCNVVIVFGYILSSAIWYEYSVLYHFSPNSLEYCLM